MLAKLVQSGGMNAIARQLEITHAAALATARDLMPGMLEGLRNFPGGIDALLELSGRYGGDQLAASVMGQGPVETRAGEAIIAQIGGIALQGDPGSDEDAVLRLRMAPLLAMLVAGYLWARSATGNLSQLEVAKLLSFSDLPDNQAPEPV